VAGAQPQFAQSLDVNWHLAAVTVNHTGNATIYRDGVKGTGTSTVSMAGVGNVVNLYDYDIGARGGTLLYKDYVGAHQIILFDVLPTNIDGIITSIYNAGADKSYPSAYSGGTIVGWWDWKNGGLDISGNGNNLTPVGNPPSVLTGISNSSLLIPSAFILFQNYPNPFNPSTTISFSLPSKSFVSLKVFDALGREVSVVLYEELSAGTYSKQWNAAGLPSGIYFYRLQARQTSGGQAGSFTETKKLLLLK